MLLSGIYFKSAKCLLNEITKDSSKNFKNKIMRQLFFIIGFFVCFPLIVNAQDSVSINRDSLLHSFILKEVHKVLAERYRGDRVTSIASVKFGMSRNKVEKILRKKYGEPSIFSTSDKLHFENIKYGGLYFNSVYFLFQSDGKRSFLNSCIFVVDVRDYHAAIDMERKISNILSKRYSFIKECQDENGNPMHICGLSPLWDGTSENFSDATIAIHTDIIDYDNTGYEYKYGVRLIYGPFDYIKEEF